MSDSDANVRQALREVRKHGQERDLLVALLKAQARNTTIAWRFPGDPQDHTIVLDAHDWLTIEQSRHYGDDDELGEPDAVAVPFDRVLDLILNLARFLPAVSP